MFTFTNKKRELLDYATTMWDAIGAMYENVYFEFPVKATLLPIVLMQNNSVFSHMRKSATLLVFWVLTLVVYKFTIAHNGQNSSYSTAPCMTNSILKYWHHISCKSNFSLLSHNYPKQDEDNIQNDKTMPAVEQVSLPSSPTLLR